jgi:hypothetical protein
MARAEHVWPAPIDVFSRAEHVWPATDFQNPNIPPPTFQRQVFSAAVPFRTDFLVGRPACASAPSTHQTMRGEGNSQRMSDQFKYLNVIAPCAGKAARHNTSPKRKRGIRDLLRLRFRLVWPWPRSGQ